MRRTCEGHRLRAVLLSADIVGPTQPLSYAGHFEVLAVADADLNPDLDIFAAGAAEEICVLAVLSQPLQDALPSTRAQRLRL
jgi:hypothetical protein